MRVVLNVWLFDDGVLFIVRVILGVLVRLWDVVVERWESWGIRARYIWPQPPVSHWLHTLEDWVAFVDEGRSVGILVAHLNDDLSVDFFLLFEIRVIAFQVVQSAGSTLEIRGILLNLVLVVVDVTRVLFNVRGVLVAEGLCVLDSVLEVRSGESQGFSGNEHVGCLGNLELVVLGSEESLSIFEAFNLLGEVWREKRS